MKKKIMVFMLLFAFLFGVLVPAAAPVPVQAANNTETTADDTKYTDIEDFMNSCGYSFSKKDGCLYAVFSKDGYYIVFELACLSYSPYFCLMEEGSNSVCFFSDKWATNYDRCFYKYWNPANASINNNFECLDSGATTTAAPGIDCPKLNFVDGNKYVYVYPCFNGLIYSDLNIYVPTITDGVYYRNFDSIVFESNLKGSYDFSVWCNDAGLNCLASSNESDSVIHFSFHPDSYYYIVRKNRISGSQYIWYLSQVTKEDELIYYSTNRALANSTIGAAALYVLSGEYAAGSTNVKNFVYDSSGAGWLYTDHYSIDLGLTNEYYVDDIGITYSSSMPIVYSSADIYSDKEQSSIYYAASTDYEDSEVTYPDISPTSTPTPTPISNSGSTDLGGNVIAGGGIDFIISLVSSLWNRVYSIPMYVDGFQITLQQLYVYGILAGIVGAAIFAFTRRK